MYSQINIDCQSKTKLVHCEDCLYKKTCNTKYELKNKKEPTNNLPDTFITNGEIPIEKR